LEHFVEMNKAQGGSDQHRPSITAEPCLTTLRPLSEISLTACPGNAELLSEQNVFLNIFKKSFPARLRPVYSSVLPRNCACRDGTE